jgi:glutaredoxin 1/glutaredoxin 3|tara:strand:+ start:3081 stop:3314 length:234 start_codon:yes stop_codon:yes gene_type:complete
MEAKMYSTARCVWCDRVAKMLEDYNIYVEKIDISGSKELLKEMQVAADKKVTSVPQVFIDNNYIGGYTEVERFLNHI